MIEGTNSTTSLACAQPPLLLSHPPELSQTHREMDTRYPSGETVFEYSVDARNKGWLAWEARLPQGGFKPPADVPAYRCVAVMPCV